MKLDIKVVVALLVVVSVLVLAAYEFGLRQAGRPVADAPPSAEAPGFTHFRVGNRNVKGMLADGNQVWVGTSGGVIR